MFAAVVAAVLGVIGVSVAQPVRAATAIVLGTTFIPDSAQPKYVRGAMEFFVKPTTLCGTQPCTVAPVRTPEQFWPLSGWRDMTIDQSISRGLDIVDDALLHHLSADSEPVVVFGDSQSSTILSLEKDRLSALSDAQKKRLVFVLVANPNRPNGGLLERIAPFTIPVIGLSGSGATATDAGIKTIDIACQYDGIADFPRYPLNVFAMLNLVAGAAIHSSYITGPVGYTEQELDSANQSPANQQIYGDTVYITIPAKHLPLVVPLRSFGKWSGLSMLTTPLADLIEPTLRVLVELGYDRSVPYGRPAKFGLFPDIDPATVAFDLVSAVRSGVDAALRDIGVATPAAAPPVGAVPAVSAPARASAVRVPAGIRATGRSPRTVRKGTPTGAPKATDPTGARPSGVGSSGRRHVRSHGGRPVPSRAGAGGADS
ncbi:PE-PPE domain-containing protein [Mycobacterium sp. shizuoka-1]|uniref:PE-PPE domain-containing protein n=1 Tax=Mycobacterium sp. shizuoka-1 TaxID=2039281 RepID=UPI000C05D890|nr:PE-PPE domain-containing protein [Mycobacterium sp. shizuoka-1]GAY17305.1 hypothetical protein MSZK_40310 [Mycobacterium sp. shizuoka-1]